MSRVFQICETKKQHTHKQILSSGFVLTSKTENKFKGKISLF